MLWIEGRKDSSDYRVSDWICMRVRDLDAHSKL